KAKKILAGDPYKNLDDIILMDSEVETVNDNILRVRSDVKNIEKRFELDKVPYSAEMVIDALKSTSINKTKKEEHRDFLFDFMDKYISDHAASREAGSLSVYRA